MPTANAAEWDAVCKKLREKEAIEAAKPVSAEEYLRRLDDLEDLRSYEESPVMPEDSKVRKGIPMHAGLLQYFPSALAAVAQVSRVCNDKHNPGQPVHWSKENSNDHQDALMRHMADTAADPLARDPEDGTLLAAKVAWRALAQLQVLHDKGAFIFAEED